MKSNYIIFTLRSESSVILNKSSCFTLKAEVKEPLKTLVYRDNKYSNQHSLKNSVLMRLISA